MTHQVSGIGHHEHTWMPKLVKPLVLNEWDITHIQCDNGWNIYYSNYRLKHTLLDSKEIKSGGFFTEEACDS